jgi:rhamnose utilization protein RhaD (predicted bifunctional aldolase and dehydrogenase)
MEHLDKSKRSKTMPKPSMEMGFHASTSDRVVIHTHPIHLNAILCSMESRAIVRGLFPDLSYDFVEYTPPGMDLANRLKGSKGIVFLENHGLIVSGDDVDASLKTTEEINRKCKMWLGSHGECFVDIDENKETTSPLFPDAAIFPEEMIQTNNYILRLMRDATLTPKFLREEDVRYLNQMSMEKYRKALS